MPTQDTLFKFIDIAEKNRSYAPATAGSYKSAIKLFVEVMNEDELNSVDKFSENFEAIYREVFNKNVGKSFSPASLNTYKNRVLRVLKDYDVYGKDPTKMANWKPTLITRTARKQKTTNLQVEKQTTNVNEAVQAGTTDPNVVHQNIPLTNGKIATLSTPKSLSSDDTKIIKGYIDFLDQFVLSNQKGVNENGGVPER